MKPKIKIDVVSDVVCPWCYIGKRRLEKSMDELKDVFEFEVIYHPFELNPTIPQNGLNHKDYLVEKFGGEDRYQSLTGRVAEIATHEGISIDFEAQSVSPNTRKAHLLIKEAKSKGLQVELTERFFRAYFSEGVDLSKDDNLSEIALAAGLELNDIKRVLNDKLLLDQIGDEEQEMAQLGITGVPFYIINEKYGISGAQTPEMFKKAFKEITNYPLLMGEVCNVEKKNC